jgi:hypothetical protein
LRRFCPTKFSIHLLLAQLSRNQNSYKNMLLYSNEDQFVITDAFWFRNLSVIVPFHNTGRQTLTTSCCCGEAVLSYGLNINRHTLGTAMFNHQ